MHRLGPVTIAVFLLPLLLSVAAGLLSIEVSSRDDWNYLTELADRPSFAATLDAVSWAVLSLSTAITGLSSMGLRWVGLVIASTTVIVLLRRGRDAEMISLFVVSILPLYVVIYFSQLRLAIALLIFTLVVTSKRLHNLAVPASALAHFSLLMLLFPPLALLIPFGLDISSQLESDSVLAFKLLAYLQNDLIKMPWYFGWEMVTIAVIVGWKKKWRLVLEIAAVVLAARIISMDMSLNVGRRILEIGMLAYSPFFLWVQRNERSSAGLIYYFLVLGILQFAISIYSGVVEFRIL
jgi:hypothetical protein